MPPKNELAPLVMMADARITKLEKAMDKAAKKVDGSTKKMTKRWKGHMRTVEKRHAKFGKNLGRNIGLGLAAGTIAFTAFTKMALQSADDLQHFSDQVGISTTKLQEYTFVASRLGISQEQMNKAFRTGTANVGEFASTGMGEAKTALEEMGLAEDILSGKLSDTGEILDILIGKLGDEDNALKRAGLAAEIFGKKSGVVLSEMLGKGTDSINKMKKEAHDLGIVMDASAVQKASDANDMLGKLGDTIKGNLTKAVVELAPEIEDMAESLIEQLPDIVQWFKNTGKALGGFTSLWNASPFGDGKAQNPTSLGGLSKQLKDLREFEEYQKKVFSSPIRSEIGFDRKGILSNKGMASKLGINIFGKEMFEQLADSEFAFEEAVADKFQSLNVAWGKAYEGFENKKQKKVKNTPATNLGGGSSSGSNAISSNPIDVDLGDDFQESLAETATQLNAAKAAFEASRTPLEEYQASLKAWAALEGNLILAQEAGGTETFTRLRISALVELADATGNYSGALEELSKLKLSLVEFEAAKDLIEQSTDETARLIEEELKLLDVKLLQVEQELLLADLRGNDSEIKQLLEKQRIIRETMDIIARGGDILTAGKVAKKVIDGQDAAYIEGQIRDAAKGAFRAAIDGEFGDYLADKLQNAASKMFDRAIDSLLDVLFNQVDLSGGKSGGGIGGLISSGISALFGGGKSYDGGGYTGTGARTGGLDGKGGFPALLHPNESVIDHTKGRGAIAGQIAGNNSSTVIQNLYYTISGVDTQQAFAYTDKKTKESYAKGMRDVDRRNGRRKRGFAA